MSDESNPRCLFDTVDSSEQFESDLLSESGIKSESSSESNHGPSTSEANPVSSSRSRLCHPSNPLLCHH